MATPNVTANTRFGRVQHILREAAGGQAAAYGGQRLWEYTRENLLEAHLYGVRLIAPEREVVPSCCADHAATLPASPGRGARSGLVQGLRGEAPFDGSRFPPLPWSGRPVTAEDVQFINDWIDDGCPADDHQLGDYTLVALETPQTTRVVIGPVVELQQVEYGPYRGTPNEYQFQRGELKQRMNLDCMDEPQLEKLRFAMRELYELNKWPEDSRSYNNLALIHQNHCQHGWERFLPWHRVYLYEFEQALQDHCPDVTMPYWDWTMPQYRPSQPDKGCIIPMALKAYLTNDSLTFLGKHGIPTDPLRDMVGVHYATLSRFFADVAERMKAAGIEKVDYTTGESRNRFIDALLDANALWYPLRYPGEFGDSTINQQIHYHYPTADDIEQILSLRTFRDFGGGSLYNDAFGFLDQNPHNTIHIWTGGKNPYKPPESATGQGQVPIPQDRNRAVQVAGRKFHKREDLYSQPPFGDMFSNLTASYDPIFWSVHVNVDRLWWEWQQRRPDSHPADLDAVLTPWSYTTRDTLDIHRFGYEYVKSTCIVPVGMEAPVGRFVSKPIEVPESVRSAFREAEVRLHRVPQLPRSCFIRVFLDLPDANANTSIEDPHYAGYLAIFGHGDCYGGPGHCDVPPLRRREYDLRPRHHNTPRNHRINVTRCAKRLLDSGATALQITLVVIGVDYQEDNELLRLEGVSLTFLD